MSLRTGPSFHWFTASVVIVLLAACGRGPDDGIPTITFMTDSIGRQLAITRDMAREFEAAHNCRVEFRIGPESATERLGEYQRFFAARSDAIDVYQIDVIWPGILGPHLVDLSDIVEPGDHFRTMIDNNTVEGRLVAVPFYGDAGLLYYRTDLLEKYGYAGPPESLDELEEMARAIMAGERAEGNTRFWGFVFQGAAYEGLTCNALEWQYGAGGGPILDRAGRLVLNNEPTREVFEKVRGWINDIAPPGVLTYREEESRTLFHSGNAAFLRNWPYVYQLGQGEDSPIRGKFHIAPFPGRQQPTSALGGWSLAVSRYSENRDLAIEFVRFLSTHEAQHRRALEGGYFATRPDVYGDPDIDARFPHYTDMEEVFLNAVARPSAPAGRAYNEISAAYYGAVHDILSGRKNAATALTEAEERIQTILAR